MDQMKNNTAANNTSHKNKMKQHEQKQDSTRANIAPTSMLYTTNSILFANEHRPK